VRTQIFIAPRGQNLDGSWLWNDDKTCPEKTGREDAWTCNFLSIRSRLLHPTYYVDLIFHLSIPPYLPPAPYPSSCTGAAHSPGKEAFKETKYEYFDQNKPVLFLHGLGEFNATTRRKYMDGYLAEGTK